MSVRDKKNLQRLPSVRRSAGGRRMRRLFPRRFHGSYLTALLLLPGLGAANGATGLTYDDIGPAKSFDEIALELSDPANGLRGITWDIEFTQYQGNLREANEQTSLRNIFTLSWPVRFNNGRHLMLRATIPVNSDQPGWKPLPELDWADFLLRQAPEIWNEQTAGFGVGHDHIGAIGFDIGYGGSNENGFSSMFAIANVTPTSEDGSARRNQWLIGPEISFAKVTGWGLFGLRARHLTDLYGEGEHLVEDVHTNETTLRLNFAYALGNGWLIESNPEILYDWEAVSGNEWIVPVGAGASRTFGIGRVPVKMGFELQYFVVSPDRFGPEWQIRFLLAPVF